MNIEEEKKPIARQLSADLDSPYSTEELLEQYSTLKSLEAFQNQPTQFYSASKPPKEIALNAALTVYTPHNATAEDIVKAATTIFEWLTK